MHGENFMGKKPHERVSRQRSTTGGTGNMNEETFEKKLAAANLTDDELQHEHDGGMVIITYWLFGLFSFGFGFFIGWVVFA